MLILNENIHTSHMSYNRDLFSKIILEEAPQGIGAAKPVRLPSSLTQYDSIQPKSILIQPKSRSRAGNVDLVLDSVNPCAICAVGDQQ